MKIGCFGDALSHTHAAAVALMRDEGVCDAEICGNATVHETLENVRNGTFDFGAIPIENSFEGTVAAAEDALGETGLYIVRETVLRVRQSLIAAAGVRLCDVRKVYSHPQALAQCRGTLNRLLPHVRTVPVAFTSAGLDMLDGESAAIARAPKEGQVVLCAHAEDSAENCTRFVLTARTPRHEGNKISVRFVTQDTPGALLNVLDVLRERGHNMTKIASRPAKTKMGQYVFFVDFLFDGDETAREELFAALGARTAQLQYLGRYASFDAAPI